MFFSDNDPNGRITRASLDGQNATVIVYRGLVRVSSLTVDPDNNLLLWVDTVRFTLEVCHYDGSHRRVVRRTNLVKMEGLQFYQVRSRDVIIPNSQYDGSHRRVVRRTNLVKMEGLSFYQVISRDVIIPNSQYDGSNMRVGGRTNLATMEELQFY